MSNARRIPLVAWSRSCSHYFSAYFILWILVIQSYLTASLGYEPTWKRFIAKKERKENKENGFWRNFKSIPQFHEIIILLAEIHIR